MLGKVLMSVTENTSLRGGVCVAGIDIGGTKTSVGLYDDSFRLLGERRFDTDARQGAYFTVSNIAKAVHDLERDCGALVTAAGLCTPGPVSVAEGKIVYIASMDWRDIPIVSMLESALGMPVFFENDTNAAALAERFLGAGRNLPAGRGNLIYITVSTGVGAGIITDDRLMHGARDWAGEFGHIRIIPGGRPCACGNDGCLETYTSGTALEKTARSELAAGAQSELRGLCGGDSAKIDCHMIEACADRGDALCLSLWSDMARRLGQGISILVQLFDPDIITLGGGVTKAWRLFGETMTDEVRRGVYEDSRAVLDIRPTELGQDICRLGAAWLAREGAQ